MSVVRKLLLTPIQAYFLGGEQNAGFGAEKRTPPFFIRSEATPTQTTLLGAVRYSVLKRHGALTPAFEKGSCAPRDLRDWQASLVGGHSFSFTASEPQQFGHILRLSPLFLQREDALYLRCPLNHAQGREEAYTPFTLERRDGQMNGAPLWIPKEYKAKQGLFSGWMQGTGARRLVGDEAIFLSQEQVGIIKSDTGAPEYGFFKKAYKRLRAGWRFVCFVELESAADLPREEIVQIGQGHSLFQMTCQEVSQTWEQLVLPRREKTAYQGLVYHAISDCRPSCGAAALHRLCDFVITQVRPFRSLLTKQDAKTYFNALQKTQRVDLLRSGSVFYVPQKNQAAFEAVFDNPTYQAVGFNQFFVWGGQ